MKKFMISIVGVIIIALIAVGCTNKNGVFVKSGLDKIHINEIISTNDVTGNVKNITDADAVSKFLDGLDSINIPKENTKEHLESGCNVPGKIKYYIELKSDNNKIVGDIIISKAGDIQVNNFENKYTKEIKNEEVANNLEQVIETNINS